MSKNKKNKNKKQLQVSLVSKNKKAITGVSGEQRWSGHFLPQISPLLPLANVGSVCLFQKKKIKCQNGQHAEKGTNKQCLYRLMLGATGGNPTRLAVSVPTTQSTLACLLKVLCYGEANTDGCSPEEVVPRYVCLFVCCCRHHGCYY